jgi:hypothetical protein
MHAVFASLWILPLIDNAGFAAVLGTLLKPAPLQRKGTRAPSCILKMRLKRREI